MINAKFVSYLHIYTALESEQRSLFRCSFFFYLTDPDNLLLADDHGIPGCSVFDTCYVGPTAKFSLSQFDMTGESSARPKKCRHSAVTIGHRAELTSPNGPQPRADGCVAESDLGWSIRVTTTNTSLFPDGGLYLGCRADMNGEVDPTHIWVDPSSDFCSRLTNYCQPSALSPSSQYCEQHNLFNFEQCGTTGVGSFSFCFLNAEGLFTCAQDTMCGGLNPCSTSTDCLVGQTCLINTGCGPGVCLNLCETPSSYFGTCYSTKDLSVNSKSLFSGEAVVCKEGEAMTTLGKCHPKTLGV